MSEFKVESDVQIPKIGKRMKYPWPEMAVGDSIFVGHPGTGSAHTAATKWGKDHGVRFTTRTESGGLRIWRVE